MKRISTFLIVAGIIGVIGPFFGLGLKSTETAEDSMGLGLILLVAGLVLLTITGLVRKK